MTEAVSNFHEPENLGSIQCDLCLQDISLPTILDNTVELKDAKSQPNWIECPVCSYHQPLKKTPGIVDMLIFGGIIGSVYMATVIAILLTR